MTTIARFVIVLMSLTAVLLAHAAASNAEDQKLPAGVVADVQTCLPADAHHS